MTCGGQAGIYTVFSGVLMTNSEIIVDKTYYPPYQMIANILAAKIVEADFENSNDVWQKITDNTKLIIINNPCNPTGKIYSKTILKNLAKCAQKRNLMILSDDVYDRIIFKNKKIDHISKFAPERTIALNSISKTFSLPGMRIGWLIGEENLIINLAKIHRGINSCPNHLAQMVIADLLPDTNDYLKNLSNEYEIRAQKINDIFYNLGWEINAPQGAIYAMPKIPNLKDDWKFALNMIKNQKVSAIPGSAFGSGGKGRLRFCFGAMRLEQIDELKHRLI